MSSMRFNARLDTSHHGPPHPFKDAGEVVDSLTGVHTAMVKWLFVNRSCIHNGFLVFPEVKIQKIQTWRAWRPCTGSSSNSLLVMLLRTSRKARLRCVGTPLCILSAINQKLNVSGHMLMWTFFVALVCGTGAQSLSVPFQLCGVYKNKRFKMSKS
jgi:hypothetical protein